MIEKPSGISDSAVRKATGLHWDEWFALMDNEGYENLSHKEIAARLYDEGHIESKWWCQSVTVGYEQAKGGRAVGETADAGFQIGVHKTLPLSVDEAWDLITSRKGRDIWLGRISKMQFVPGQEYRTEEGTTGEIRTVVPGNRMRFSWKPKDWRKSSNVQIRINQRGEKASIGVHHDRLESTEQREQMRDYWRDALERLQKLIAE